MPTTQTLPLPPPIQGSQLTRAEQAYLSVLQAMFPLRKVDTTAGPYAESVPSASGGTGQSNQNVEITFVKVSADANVFTLNGVEGGPVTLNAQYDHLKIKSDGSKWYRTG